MNVQHNLTTVLQIACAPMWKDHFNVHAYRDLREMAKHALVGLKNILNLKKKKLSPKDDGLLFFFHYLIIFFEVFVHS